MPDGLFGWPGYGVKDARLYDTQIFTSSGTWVKPAKALWVWVLVSGPGSGGGSGRKGAAASARGGGSGSGGGKISMSEFLPSVLPSSVPVTIGAGSVGANAVTTNSTNGGFGGINYNFTFFGSILKAGSSSYGQGGQTGLASASTGAGSGMIDAVSSSAQWSQGGNFPFSWNNSPMSNAGGSAGGSIDASGNLYGPSASRTAAVGSYAPNTFYISIGGAGGAASTTAGVNGGTGGNGLYGGGGGGGGAGTDNVCNSGAGGRGGDGVVIVTTLLQPSPFNVQVFDSSGVWRKPFDSRYTRVRVFALGGGGGGAGGRRGAAGVLRAGGGGGGAGSANVEELPISILPASVDVTVGTGGAGGAAPTADDTNGGRGGDGGTSSFGIFVSAPGAFGGKGLGIVDSGYSTGSVLFPAMAGGSGGNGAAGTSIQTNSTAFTTGGGGGAGISAANGTFAGGTTYSPGFQWATVAAATSATDPLNNAVAFYAGIGGGGGSSNGTPDGGNGSLGCGGGGGAATVNGGTGGAGGNGGDGRVIVICY